jgi:hypothetical protein
MIPATTQSGGGQMEQGRPGKGATLCCRNPCSLSPLVLLFANFLASPLASQGGLHAFFFTGFQVKRVALNLFDNVFLLHFALEAAQSVFEGFTLLQSNFRQTDTPPNPSGRTE